MTQHQSPCSTCPFRRDITPGYLGGSPVTTFVGQTEAGFNIPCHSCIDYDDPDWKAKASVPGTINECAGAAIFRANIDRQQGTHATPSLVLSKDTDMVFASHAEFVAHHMGITVEQADLLLQTMTPAALAHYELSRAGCVVTIVEKK